jgi:hypothetical protein
MLTVVWVTAIFLLGLLFFLIGYCNTLETGGKIAIFILIAIFLSYTFIWSLNYDCAIRKAENVGVSKKTIVNVANSSNFDMYDVANYLNISVKSGTDLEDAISNLNPALSESDIENLIIND